MSSITAQQTKLDIELVPKENRLDIRKCNGTIPHRLTPREPTLQVVLDAIALTPCYPAFLITADIPEICPRVPGRDFDPLPSKEDTVSFLRELGHTEEINSLNDIVFDQMHEPLRTFAALINRGLSGKTSGLDKLRLSNAQILWESTQIYGSILPECLTSPVMKGSKAYKTYLGYATGVVPPKMDRKFKKASPSKIDSDLVPVDEEPVQKGKRVKRPAKKSTTKNVAGVVIREAPVETKSKSKEKEKVDVTRRKGIEFLSEVALIEEAQMKEVRKKSLRDFDKTHPIDSGTVAKKPPSVDKITPTVISEGTGDKPGVPDVTKDDSTNKEEEFIHTPSPTDDNLELESDDVIKSDEEKGMDDTTYQFDDDVDARLKEPTQTDKEVVQD
ncbi:hypothetical protein Tco_0739465 [Tanacetum coccineum]